MSAALRVAFYDAVIAFAGTESLRVAFPNIPFNPGASDDFYLAVSPLPVEPSVVSVCGETRRRYVLQVSVVSRDSKGDVYAAEYADKLADAFPIHSELAADGHAYQVMTPPSARPAIPEDGWFSIPVDFIVQAIH